MKNTALQTPFIKVVNAANEPETSAEIIVHNSIDYTPKVSVIIPVYNVKDFLHECVDSVLNQTLNEIEVICVDDGSTDGSLEILKGYAEKDCRVTIIRQSNIGAGTARNAGLSVAKGEYLSFLDSDDYFEREMLSECYGRLKKDASDICIYSAQMIDYSIMQTKEMVGMCPKEDCVLDIDELKGEILCKTSPNCWNKIFRRSLINDYNIKFQSIANANDVYFSYLATCLARKISVIPKMYIHYRYNTGKQISAKLSQVSPLNIVYALSHLKEDIVKIKGESFLTEGFYKKYIGMLKYQRIKNFMAFEKNRSTYKDLFPPEKTYMFENAFKPGGVFLALDDKNEKNAVTTITSIQKNLPTGYACRIFIIHENLSERVKTNLLKLSTAVTSIEFVDVSSYLEKYHISDLKNASKKKYYKFLIPQILKGDDKVLYIDCNVDICGSVMKLFQEDLKQNFIASTNGTSSTITKLSDVKHEKCASDLNTGLIMFNVPVWNRMGMTQKCLDLAPEHLQSNEPDRDILNMLCKNRIHFFPQECMIFHNCKKNNYGQLKRYIFFPYHLFRPQKNKETNFKIIIKHIVQKLSTMRIDIKNTGSDKNAITIKAKGAKISQPKWFTNARGIGQIVESFKPNQEVYIKAINDGTLVLNFRGPAVYHKGKRFPLWIDYKSIKINDKEILRKPVTVWHDQPFHYDIPVKNGQILHVKTKQNYHTYNRSELKDIIKKLNLDIDCRQSEVINKVYRKMSHKGVGYFLFHEIENERCKKFYICGIRVWKRNTSIYNYFDLCVSRHSHAELEQMQALKSSLQDYVHVQVSQLKNAVDMYMSELGEKIDTQFIQLKTRDIAQYEKFNALLFEQHRQLNLEISNYTQKLGDLFSKHILTCKDDNYKAHLTTQNLLHDSIRDLSAHTETHKQQLNIQNRILSIQENIESKLGTIKDEQQKAFKEERQINHKFHSALTQEIKDKTNTIITAVEREQVLYNNLFEVRTRTKRGFCDITDAPNFEERFRKLISGLPEESVGILVSMLARLKLAKNMDSKMDLYTPKEKAALKLLDAYNRSIFKISDNLYCYKNYLLPIRHFEASVFFYRHGLEVLKHPERFMDKAILDVGAFVGDSALILSPLTKDKVYSFEASGENYNLLLKTIELNNLKNIVPIKAAVGAEKSTIELKVNGSSTTSSVMMIEPKYTETCEVIKVDDYVKENNLKVGLIKVDIEGAEQEFLKGAMQTIMEQKPTLLISIYHNIDDFLDIKPLIESWGLGYSFSIYKPIISNISTETLLVCEQ